MRLTSLSTTYRSFMQISPTSLPFFSSQNQLSICRFSCLMPLILTVTCKSAMLNQIHNKQHKTTTTTTTTTTNNNNQQPTTNNQQPTTNTNNGYKVGEAMPSHERATKVAMLPRHTYPTNVSLTATFLSHTTTSINNIDFTIGLDGNDRHQATQCDRCPARAAEDGSSR
jgi:hypothetical protein